MNFLTDQSLHQWHKLAALYLADNQRVFGDSLHGFDQERAEGHPFGSWVLLASLSHLDERGISLGEALQIHCRRYLTAAKSHVRRHPWNL